MNSDTADLVIHDIATDHGARVSRHVCERALLSAQTGGYYGIDISDGRINVTFGDTGFEVKFTS